MSSLLNVFLQELAETYELEKRLPATLAKLTRAASHPGLKEAFHTHYLETREHARRLEEVFQDFGRSPKARPSKPLAALLQAIERGLRARPADTALIAAAQKVEHYEIAAYGSLYFWARRLQNHVAADLLHETLLEERFTEDKLTTIAEAIVSIVPDEQKRRALARLASAGS